MPLSFGVGRALRYTLVSDTHHRQERLPPSDASRLVLNKEQDLFTRPTMIVVSLLIVCSITVLAQSPPQVLFLSAVNYGVAVNPYSVAVGNFDGVGKPDLAVANNGDSNVSVLLGRGELWRRHTALQGGGGGFQR